MTTEERIKSCVVKVLAPDPEDIHLGARLDEDLAIDSLDLLDLVMELEQEFSEKGFASSDEGISADDADKWETVADIVRFVEGAASCK